MATILVKKKHRHKYRVSNNGDVVAGVGSELRDYKIGISLTHWVLLYN